MRPTGLLTVLLEIQRGSIGICTGSARRYVHCVVTSYAFDTFIVVVICASSIALAAEDPVDATSIRNTVLSYVDNAFTVLFALEMLLKVTQHVQFKLITPDARS